MSQLRKQRARKEISKRCSGCGRGNDCCPVEPGIEFRRLDLRKNQHNQRRHKDAGADQVTPARGSTGGLTQPAHADGIASGFAERCRQDLDDPESQRDGRNLGQCCIQFRTIHVQAFNSRGQRRCTRETTQFGGIAHPCGDWSSADPNARQHPERALKSRPASGLRHIALRSPDRTSGTSARRRRWGSPISMAPCASLRSASACR